MLDDKSLVDLTHTHTHTIYMLQTHCNIQNIYIRECVFFRYRLQASFILNPHEIDLISEDSPCRVHILLSLNENPVYVTSRITVYHDRG